MRLNGWMMLLGIAGMTGCGNPDISAADGDATSGEALFTANCMGCHGADATGGGGGPDIAGISDSNPVINTILDGAGSMPSFADTLSDQEVSDILAWLGSL